MPRYRILVSEVMLQQTQVERVLDYYPRFLRQYQAIMDLGAVICRAVKA